LIFDHDATARLPCRATSSRPTASARSGRDARSLTQRIITVTR
jgi:hypothetical protein